MMRDEKKVEGCLLSTENTKLVSSKGAVILCGLCDNRSDMVGNLAESCVLTKVAASA